MREDDGGARISQLRCIGPHHRCRAQNSPQAAFRHYSPATEHATSVLPRATLVPVHRSMEVHTHPRSKLVSLILFSGQQPHTPLRSLQNRDSALAQAVVAFEPRSREHSQNKWLVPVVTARAVKNKVVGGCLPNLKPPQDEEER